VSEPFRVSGPMPLTQILDESLRWARRFWKPIVLPLAAPLCLLAALVPFANGQLFSAMPRHGAPPDLGAFFGGFAVFFLAILVFLVVIYLAYTAMIVAACQAVSGNVVSIRQAWLFALRLPAFGTLLLLGLGIWAGMLCCLLPGIYLACMWSMVVPVMVLESTMGTNAMRRSAELTRYNPGGQLKTDPRLRIFVMLFAGYLVGYGLNFAIQLPVAIVQQILMFRMMSRGFGADPATIMPELMAKMAWIQVPTQVLGILVQLLVHLYIAFSLALMYLDLKHRREATDLEAGLAEITGLPPAIDPGSPSP
jgi:hypothetical protein